MASYSTVDGILTRTRLTSGAIDTVTIDATDGSLTIRNLGPGAPIYFSVDGGTPVVGTGPYAVAVGTEAEIPAGSTSIEVVAADASEYQIAPTSGYQVDATKLLYRGGALGPARSVESAIAAVAGGGGGGGATSLDGLSDVVITAAAVGEILRHDGVRWVNASDPSGEFNVIDYGATGLGVADDTAAINSAITAAAAVDGTVIVPPGTYLVDFTDNVPISGQTTAIRMKSGVKLAIYKGATIKLKPGATSANAQNTAIIRNEGAFASSSFDTDMAIFGSGVIDGNAANNTGVIFNGIYLGTARRAYVRDLTVKNCRGTSAGPPNETMGINFYRCVDYGCTDVEVFGDDGGVTATGIGSNFCSVGKFVNCTVHDLTYGAGLTHYKSALVSTINCHVYKVGGNGFLTENSDDIDFVACYAGGRSSDMDGDANQVAPITGTTLLGCAQDTAASSGLNAGFRIDTGTRIRILGGASAYNGTDSYVAAGVKIVGTCTGIEIDDIRVFANTNGIDFTNGDGAAACVARMRATRVGRGTVLGPNKKPGGAGSNSEVLTSSGSMTASEGEINAFLVTAHAAIASSTVAVPNPFPFDCDVVLAGGTISAVSVTPGGPAPSAATSVGLTRLVRVPHGGSITLTYSSAPTWKWFAFTGGVGDLIIGTDVQAYDSDIAAIAALTTTSYGRALLELANQAALLTAVGTASTTATGVVELATDAETVTGTDTARATTPSGVAAAIAAGGGGGSTNLAYTAAPTNGTVTSDTGTDATLSLADGTNAGLMAPAQHTKLAGIETGATADQTAAEILAALLTVDGTGSGLDADLLDGNSSAAFATAAHNHAAADINSGTMATARLGSGTADATTFLRGDQTYATAVQLPRYKAGWYFGSPLCTSSNTQARGSAQMSAVSVQVFQATPIDQLALNVGTAATTGTLRLGVYADDGSGYPGSLVAGGGATNEVVTSTGVKTVTVSYTLQPGLYWFAAQQEFTGSFGVQGATNGSGNAFAYASTVGAGNNVGLNVTSVSGSMPSTWPGSPATTATGNPAHVLARAA